MNRIRVIFCTLLLGGAILSGYFLAYKGADAQTTTNSVTSEVDRIRNEINQRNDRLKEITAEIEKYQTELQKVGSQKNTLQSAINRLELERKKVQSDLSYTQNKIGTTDLEIERLDLEISQTSEDIERNRAGIKEILQRVDEIDDTSMIETFLRNDTISDLWVSLDELRQVRDMMNDEVKDLSDLRDTLDNKLGENHQKRGELVTLKNAYSDQQQVLTVNKNEKNQLLTKTKSEEANYQALLAQQQAEKDKFEKELRALEQQLKFTLDPSSIPTAGSNVFAWPLDSVRITQYFGDTEFSRTAAYNGSGHNGMDFGTPTGSVVHASLAGTVQAVNTQVAPMCQYGKWVLIRHANGLSTLYAHLSVVSVNSGDQVGTGDTIGYSGATGYATGPHLHFTVYASDAVKFTQYTCNSGITLTIPVSATTGYLNPALYLPQ